MHFAGFGEQAEGFPDVCHGRDFDDEAAGVFQEEGFQLEDVGFAVGEGEDAAVAVGAASGVGVAGVGAEVAEEVAGVGVEDADAGGAEGGEVVAGGFAVEGVAFYACRQRNLLCLEWKRWSDPTSLSEHILHALIKRLLFCEVPGSLPCVLCHKLSNTVQVVILFLSLLMKLRDNVNSYE